MMQGGRLYRANVLHTPRPDRFEIVERGYVHVDAQGYVTGVYGELPAGLGECEVEDFGDTLLIPAMNDLHVHAPQYRNQGMAMDLELLPWLSTYTFPEEARYSDRRYAEVMYRRFVRDLWRHGTMRASIFATIHKETAELLATILDEAGMGGLIGVVGMDTGCPDNLRNSTEEVVNDTLSLIDHTSGMPLVSAIVTPRFVPSCSCHMLTELGKTAQRYRIPVQSHLSENQGEVALVRKLFPDSSCYGAVYDRFGLFGQTPTLMAHCCYTDGEELELMKKNHVFVVHCPISNCDLGSGIAPIRRFLDAGLPVALGSDMAGGHDLSLFRVMQSAIQMSKLLYARTEGEWSFLSLSEAFHLATKSGGAFFGKVGCFEPGYSFDALVIDDSELNRHDDGLAGSAYTVRQRMERYIYLGDDRQIVHRFCQGREITEPRLSDL
ncbi:MAG: amidohydrolase family protein [Bacteroidaceae bacterium]|nr:amidohydrolase family protein [Bacteroidaceae bacterium]